MLRFVISSAAAGCITLLVSHLPVVASSPATALQELALVGRWVSKDCESAPEQEATHNIFRVTSAGAAEWIVVISPTHGIFIKIDSIVRENDRLLVRGYAGTDMRKLEADFVIRGDKLRVFRLNDGGRTTVEDGLGMNNWPTPWLFRCSK